MATGIYLNKKTAKARRVGATLNAPKDKDWVLLSDDTNLGILKIRELAAQKKVMSDASAITWE